MTGVRLVAPRRAGGCWTTTRRGARREGERDRHHGQQQYSTHEQLHCENGMGTEETYRRVQISITPQRAKRLLYSPGVCAAEA